MDDIQRRVNPAHGRTAADASGRQIETSHLRAFQSPLAQRRIKSDNGDLFLGGLLLRRDARHGWHPPSTTLEASSLYNAAEKATREWSRLWWYNSSELITVRHGEQQWKVSQERMRGWSTRRLR